MYSFNSLSEKDFNIVSDLMYLFFNGYNAAHPSIFN